MAHARQLEVVAGPARARGKFEEAAASARRAVGLKPRDGWAQLQLGRCLLALGRSEEALGPLGQAVACRPEEVGTHLALGTALLERGELAEARRCLERAAALPGGGRREVSEALNELGRKEKAARP
jgi:Flp pilus assembly protein TadD